MDKGATEPLTDEQLAELSRYLQRPTAGGVYAYDIARLFAEHASQAERVRELERELDQAKRDAVFFHEQPVWRYGISASEAAVERMREYRKALGDKPFGEPMRDCDDNSQPWFRGHWRDWHRGHGCNKDDGKSRSAAGVAEIEAHDARAGRGEEDANG